MSAIGKWTDDEQITGMTRYAKAYSGSDFFKDAKSVEKAFVIISAGAEIGIAPFAAITGIALIQGKPVIGAGILAGLVKAHPKYDYQVKQLDDDACVLTFFQEGKEIGESSFTMDDAKRAGLAGKDVWKNYPRNMLFARAISNGVVFYTPDVTTTRVYTEGELDEITPAPRSRPASRTRREPESPAVPGETVVEAVLVSEEAAPATPPAAEASDVASVEADAAASSDGSITPPVDALAAVLKGMEWEQRKVVKERIAALGIDWNDQTPAALVAHFAGNDDGLVALLKADSNGEVDQGENFQAWIDEQDARRDEAGARLAAAGEFGS